MDQGGKEHVSNIKLIPLPAIFYLKLESMALVRFAHLHGNGLDQTTPSHGKELWSLPSRWLWCPNSWACCWNTARKYAALLEPGEYGTVLGTWYIFRCWWQTLMALPSCFFSGCLSKTFEAARFMLSAIIYVIAVWAKNLLWLLLSSCQLWAFQKIARRDVEMVVTTYNCFGMYHTDQSNAAILCIFTRPKARTQDSCTTYCLELGTF